eukprot:SAG11_NODE_2912_length_2844_cov_4.296539_1_plen_297_part_00
MIADVQYGDKPAKNGRTYRESLGRLTAAVEHLNDLPALLAVLHLGDVIDGRETLGESVEDLSAVLACLGGLRPRPHKNVLHAIGNHDLAVPREKLAAALGLDIDQTYFSIPVAGVTGWRLVVLDTVCVCRQFVDEGFQRPAPAADRWLAEHADLPNAVDWNGAIGEEQRDWLDGVLAACDAAGERVLVCGHNPLLPEASDETHCAWDGAETCQLLDRHPSVVAYLNGHDHRGGYGLSTGGVHHITIAGMVQSPLDSNAYGVLRVFPDILELEGFGTQVHSRVLPCRGATPKSGARL